MKIKAFIKDLLTGAAIGVAMIIPGVSGGTIAVLTNVYDKLIEALGGFLKNLKQNIAFLLPILSGAVLAFVAAYFPLNWALDRAPFPTVMLFAGLMAGSLPKIFGDCRGYGFKKADTCAVFLPFLIIIGVCVMKIFVAAGDADLSSHMPIWGYVAVFGVAMLASCALVVPGISGSMLLMISGYYEPILALFKSLMEDFWHSAAVLAIFAAGLIIGFFTIAKLMKYLLGRFPRGTHWAIFGFVLGSLPAIFIVFDYAGAVFDGLQVAAGMVLFALGLILSYALTYYAQSKKA